MVTPTSIAATEMLAGAACGLARADPRLGTTLAHDVSRALRVAGMKRWSPIWGASHQLPSLHASGFLIPDEWLVTFTAGAA